MSKLTLVLLWTADSKLGYLRRLIRRKAATLATRSLALIFSCIFVGGCHSQKEKQGPSIEFTKIPPAAQGGRERVDTIAGRVRNARPGQQVVIYAHSGPWWVQPWPDRPIIPIRTGSTWSTETHLGYEYAALLVEPDYHPPATMDVAPAQGGSVVLVSIVKGTGTPTLTPTKPLTFSGYDWSVRTTASDRGGTNNRYSGENASVDDSGAMHMRITRTSEGWACSEVHLNRSLGYGTYVFVVRDTSQLEPAVVFDISTFDEFGGDQHYREMDIEVSRWGDADSKSNAQYGIEPFYVPGNISQFIAPAGTLTHMMHWESGRATFKTFREASVGTGRPLFEHEFTSGVPSQGRERIMIFFYAVPSNKSPLQKEAEVVVEKFEYHP
jgi:hypothetical protein